MTHAYTWIIYDIWHTIQTSYHIYDVQFPLHIKSMLCMTYIAIISSTLLCYISLGRWSSQKSQRSSSWTINYIISIYRDCVVLAEFIPQAFLPCKTAGYKVIIMASWWCLWWWGWWLLWWWWWSIHIVLIKSSDHNNKPIFGLSIMVIVMVIVTI